MKQNISVMRARTHNLKLNLIGPDGKPHVMTQSEKLIFGVKKCLTDTEYVLSKTIGYQEGFEAVESQASAPTWEANKYYSKTTSGGVDTYTLTTQQPSDWSSNYTNYYVNNGRYLIGLTPADTESLSPSRDYFYDIGLQIGSSYYSVINTSRFYLEGNVTTKEE